MRTLVLGLLIGCGGTAVQAPSNTKTGHDLPSSLTVTWVISPVVPDPKDPSENGLPLRPITLIAGTEKIELEPLFGSLHSYNQSVCKTTSYPLAQGELAKITFYEGGAAGYLLRKTPRGLAVINWALGDGACQDPTTNEMIPCKQSETVVRTIDAAPGIVVTERMVVIDLQGKETPFPCDPDFDGY